MAQHYSNPKRENEPHVLPDIETFEIEPDCFPLHTIFECGSCGGYHNVYSDCDCRDDDQRYGGVEDYATRNGLEELEVKETDTPAVGWYWWSCSPGCLPDGEPYGPFATEAEALADAREGMDDDDDSEGDES